MRYVRPLLTLVFALFALLILFLPKDVLPGGTAASVLPLLAASALLYFRKEPHALAPQPKAQRIYTLILTALFLLMLSAPDLYCCGAVTVENVAAAGYDSSIARLIVPAVLTLYLPLTAASAYILIDALLRAQYEAPADADGQKPYCTILGVRVFRAIIPLLVLALLFALAAFPYWDLYDFKTFYSALEHGEWNSWNPVAYNIFMLLFRKLFPNWFFNVLLRCALLITVINYALCVLYDYTKSSRATALFAVAFAASFTPFLYVQYIVKDSLFADFLLAFVVACFDFIRVEAPARKQYALLAGTAVLASIFRQGGLAIVLITLVFLLFSKSARRKARLTARLWVLAAPLATSILFSFILGSLVLHVQKTDAYVKYSIPLYMAAAVVSKTDDIDASDAALLEELMPIERWQAGYRMDRYWTNTVSREWGVVGERIDLVDDAYGMRIVALNAKFLFQHPLLYLESFFDITSVVWEIGTPYGGKLYAPTAFAETGGWEQESYAGTLYPSAALTFVQYLACMCLDVPFLAAIFYRGGLWVFLSVALGIMLLMRKRANMLPLLIPSALYFVLLMLSCPNQHSRYILPLMQAAVFLFFITTVRPAEPGARKAD